MTLPAAMLFLAASASASAQIAETPNFTFNGFGTLGLIHSNEDQADFVSRPYLVPKGVGYSDTWTPRVDSRLGLQITGKFTSRLSGVLQVVAEQQYDGSYMPAVEWANMRFDFTPDWSLRAGRMALPMSMAAEYRKVGYAMPWIRPPQEIYTALSTTSIDGMDLSYRTNIGAFTNTLRATFGRRDEKMPSGGKTEARNGLVLSNTLEWGHTSVFAQYSDFDLTVTELAPLFDAFRQFGPQGQAIADRYDIDGKSFESVGLGVRYDPGEWFLMGEWLGTKSRTMVADLRAWYLSGGYRIGSFTPYVTVARVKAVSATSDPGLSLDGLPPEVAAQAAALNDALNELLATATRQKSLALGVRWDFARNMALKAQFDYIDLDTGSQGTLVDLQPGFQRGGTLSLFSLALDFVF